MRFWYFAVSAGLLVLLVLAIQKKWRNQLSAKARYALWILPMIRLLIPFGMAELPEGNVMSLPYAAFEYTVNAFREGDMADQGGEIPAGSASGERSQDAETSGAGGAAFPAGPEEDIQTDRETRPAQETESNAVQQPQAGIPAGISWVSMASGVLWACGSVILGAYAFRSNWKLKKMTSTRCQIRKDGRLPVYVGEIPGTPCLFGVLRPCVLMSSAIWEDEEVRRYALRHEAEHYRQKDHIWSFVRVLFCVVYWWHPLVWLGVIRSREDAELACDEGVIRGCKRLEKKEYGLALLKILEYAGKGPSPLCGATAMRGGQGNIRRRLEAMVDAPSTKTVPFAASFLILTGALLAGCTVLPDTAQMRVEVNPDKAAVYTLEADYHMDLPGNTPGRLLYFEVYEYGEKTGSYKVSYLGPEELKAAGEDADLTVRFGQQWDWGLWNYLEITEGKAADRETYYFPPLEGNPGFADSALWNDGALHRTEKDKEYVLAAEFRSAGDMTVSYGCEYLTENPREEWNEYFDGIDRAVLVRMVLSDRTEEELTEKYGLEAYEQTITELPRDEIDSFAQRWADAFTRRDGTAIRDLSAQSVQEKMEEDGLLYADAPEAFGDSSPWPWVKETGAMNYRILEADENGIEILYYAIDSTPHMAVWRESLSLVYVNGAYQAIGEELQYLDQISTAAEYFQAYPDGIISATRMDYTSNGLGEILNDNALQNPESELYSRLFDPEEAARSLLNLSDDVEIRRTGMITGAPARTTLQIVFSDQGSVSIRMEQPWGETGIWVPASASFENL